MDPDHLPGWFSVWIEVLISGIPAHVITVKVRGGVVLFEHGLAKEDEGQGDGEAVKRLPFFPDSVEGFPSQLSRRTVHEAMLGGFREVEVATFAGGLDSHRLEPGAHR
ncbi:unnamed protein product [Sphagnum balticum]